MKIRFNHASAKNYLKDKFTSKLLLAEQGGLWTASPELISFLSTMDTVTIVLIDNFSNPVLVDRSALLSNLKKVYTEVMTQWHAEWTGIESKR